MSLQRWGFVGPVLVFGGLCIASVPALGGDFVFRKQVVSTQYWSEGADMGDFNKDGKPDLVSGPFWYEGPGFTVQHEYNVPKALAAAGAEYTTNFFAWSEDIDRDGWNDILIVGLPGTQAYWYQNPGAADVSKPIMHWKQSLVLAEVGNESPAFLDYNGDGKKELFFNTNDGYFGWAEPNASDPSALWRFHALSSKGNQQRYTHGLGMGDVNGDGRKDLLEQNGWWEQPLSLVGDPVWKFHAFAFNGGGAQMLSFDVDGDGDSDVVSTMEAHGFGLAWFEQVKVGADISFKKHMIMGNRQEVSLYGLAFSQLHALAVVDIDGDGLLDLITGKRKWAHGPSGDIEPNEPAVLYAFQLKRMADSVKFIPIAIDSSSGVGTQLEVKDIDGNGQNDILIGNKNGTFVFFKAGQSNEIRAEKAISLALKELSFFHRGYDIKGRSWQVGGGILKNTGWNAILPLRDPAD